MEEEKLTNDNCESCSWTNSQIDDDNKSVCTKIDAVGYDSCNIEILNDVTPSDVSALINKFQVLWVDIVGLGSAKTISQLGEEFKLHPLTVEDLLSTAQLPKLDIFENHIFIVIHVYFYDDKSDRLKSDQIAFILGNNFVISVQERESAIFEPIKTLIKNQQSLIRKKGADYLVHALLDLAVDTYYRVLECIGDVIERLEEKVIDNATPAAVKEIHTLKRNVIFLRKSVWPLREIISGLHHKTSDLIQDSTLLYLKDVYDHTVQIIDTVETYRDLLSGIMDIYISSINNKLNEVMKVLTVFATIFIPLTFISSLYGMNFNTSISKLNMPELNWRYGYISVLIIMFAVTIAMLLFFKRKKWL